MGTARKNKNGVKNTLVNNINARKKAGKSRAKRKSTISSKAYSAMQNNWRKANPRKGSKKSGRTALKRKTAHS